MKTPLLVLVLLFFCSAGQSQKVQAIVPAQVVVGNAFQVQYIINDPSAFVSITPPQFENLQLVSGPNYYKGSSVVNGRQEQIENVTFTVVPLQAGKARINAVTVRFKDNEEQKSDDIVLTVQKQPKASFNTTSTYTDLNLYAPSSKTDLDKLIDANLFIKTEVDKRVCYLGEAITATFKLYSRLQSTSEVLNAPSLYGFSVMDMLDINEAHQAVETIGGKIFNTSILRKLQLYPSQTGTLSIDPMQLQNTIEFSDSDTHKKVTVVRFLASPQVDIVVKPFPSAEPMNYTGAVGQFTISADIPRRAIAVNRQGKLLVTIAGTGNFLQFSAPVITWPKEFEVFDPVVSDTINKEVVPTVGKRTYLYSFTAEKGGRFIIPPISFSFFDPRTRRYNQLTTDSLTLAITAAKAGPTTTYGREVFGKWKGLWLFILVAIVVVLGALLLWRKYKMKYQEPASVNHRPTDLERLDTLQSVPDQEYFTQLYKLLQSVSKENILTTEQKEQLTAIQQECQLLSYSRTRGEGARQQLQKRTGDLLTQIAS
jgi:hypothetical protein